MEPRLVGVVTAWHAAGGWGFLDTGRGRVFAHATAVITGPLAVGDLAEFVLEPHPRGPRALRVRRLAAVCPKCDAALHGLDPCGACGFRF